MLVPHRSKSYGFSIPELMIAIAMFAILLSTSIPYMRTFLTNVEIKTASEALLNGIQLARSEAVKRNTNVKFTLGTNSSWTVGCETPNNNLVDGVEICPASIQARDSSEGSTGVNVAVLPAGSTTVTFNGIGLVTPNSPSTQTITEINVSDTSVANTRALRVQIAGSSVRECNPAHQASIAREAATACL